MPMVGVDLVGSAFVATEVHFPSLGFHTQSSTKLARPKVPSADSMATPATAPPDQPAHESVDGVTVGVIVVVMVTVAVAVAVDGSDVDVVVEFGLVM